MASHPTHLLSSIQALVSQGRLPAARDAIRAARRVRVPRSLRRPLATAARQAGLPQMGIRWLGPVIHPPGGRKGDPSPAEVAEFAMCLVRIGAFEEAADLMKRVKSSRETEVLLARIFVLAPQWDYGEIARVAGLYLERGGLTSVQRIIGQLNLGAALVHERRLPEAASVLGEVLRAAKAEGLPRFIGNALELSAQWAIHAGEWDRARDYLEEADRRLRGAGTLDELFIRKWRSVLELKRHRTRSSERAISKVRDEAADRGHWETVRDCDWWLGTVMQDAAILERVYFGTPLECYRAHLLRENPAFRPPATHRRPLGGRSGRQTVTVEVGTGRIGTEGSGLRPGGVVHRLLFSLAADYYRPRRLASLHYHVYPGEFFNPDSAPLRVHQGLWRLREWIRENRLPLVIRETDKAYRMDAIRPMFLQYRLAAGCESPSEVLIGKLERCPTPVAASEVAALMNVSVRSAQRLLLALVRRGKIVRSGPTKGCRYSLA